MKEELIKALNNERKELNIPKDKFLKMIKYTLEYQKTNPNLSIEEIIEIIRVTMHSYDYSIKLEDYKDCIDITNVRAAYSGRKSVGESFLVALNALGHINQYENVHARER